MDRSEFSDDWEAVRREHAADADADARAAACSEQCAKCGRICSDADSLETHFEEAQHHMDADYPVFRARVRVELAAEAVRSAEAKLDEARAELACGHVSEFGVCVARRGHLLGHDFAVVEQRTEPYVLDAALTVGERNR